MISRRRLRWLVVGVLLLAAAALAVFVLRTFVVVTKRTYLSRTRSDMRYLGGALESYFADHRAYPPFVMRRAHSANAGSVTDDATDFRTFALMLPPPGFRAHSLTTPVAYARMSLPDFYAPTRGDTFAYFTDGGGWILVSPGPDEDFDLMMEEGDLDYAKRNDTIERMYDSSIPQPSPTLIAGAGPRGAFTYDPTNGTMSSGDVWRVSEGVVLVR